MYVKKLMAPVLMMILGNALILGGVCLIMGIFTAPIGFAMLVQGTKMSWEAGAQVLGK